MAACSGKLQDFNSEILSAHPVLWFTPTGSGVSDRAIFAAKAVTVTTFGTGGSFDVDLEPTIGMYGKVLYKATVAYFDSSTFKNELGRAEWPIAFGVPPEGGDLRQLMKLSVTSDTVYCAPDVSADGQPDVVAGFKMNTVTGDIYVREFTND